MNLVKLKKEKIDVDYRIDKIENIIVSKRNLEEYISLIENNKQDTPKKLTNKIIDRINEVKVSGKIKYEINDNENNKGSINNEITSFYKTGNIKSENNVKVIKRLERKFIEIIKIAACTVFALLIWEMTPTNVTYAQNNAKVEEIEKVDENKKEYGNKLVINRKVSNFFMRPISIERREK